jgi:hypothetical protein
MSRFDYKLTTQVSLKIIQSELLEDHKHAILHPEKDDSLRYAIKTLPLRQNQITNPSL